jgi:hypothetical protein
LDYQIAVDRCIQQEPEMKEYNKAFFTGHRGINSSVSKSINKLIDMAIVQGVTEFFSGMAFGTDLLALERYDRICRITTLQAAKLAIAMQDICLQHGRFISCECT